MFIMGKDGLWSTIFTPLKFAASSLISFCIDYGLYAFFIGILKLNAAVSYLIARSISAVFNFCLNKLFVFKENCKSNTFREAASYFVLVVVIAFLGTTATSVAVNKWDLNEYITKPVIDAILFTLSYFVQRLFIFKQREKHNETKEE